MKKLIIFLLIFISIKYADATTYQTVANGNWNSSSVWSPSVPSFCYGSCDTVIVNHTINMNKNLTSYGVFIISTGASLSNSGKNLTIGCGGTFTNGGTVSVKNFKADWGTTTITNNGSLTVANSMNIYEGTFVNNGTIDVTNNFNNQYDNSFTNSSTGNITVGGNFKNYDEFTNAGTLTVTGTVTNDWSCDLTNSGTISSGGNFTNNGDYSSSGTTTVGGNFKSTDDFTNSGNMTVTGTVINDWSSTMSNTGTITSGSDFINKGSLTSSGTLNSGGDFKNVWGTTFTNSGNLNVGDDFLNQGTITNNGNIDITDYGKNQGTINNNNNIDVGGNFNNDWGSTVNNDGSISVDNNLSNNGTVHNDGSMEVDGNYSGSGNVDGTGSLCNSDGVTDPTGGSKSVTCPICGDAGTLPVELVEFNCEFNGNGVDIKWVTLTEINNEKFEVMKSEDGINFTVISTVDGAGNSNTQLNYSVIDENSGSGIVYYRLNQIDFDGQSHLSSIIKVEIEKHSFTVDIYPNPVNSGEDIKIDISAAGNSNIEIYNATGSLVKEFNTSDNLFKINTGDIPKGIYYLRITNNNTLMLKKIEIF